MGLRLLADFTVRQADRVGEGAGRTQPLLFVVFLIRFVVLLVGVATAAPLASSHLLLLLLLPVGRQAVRSRLSSTALEATII